MSFSILIFLIITISTIATITPILQKDIHNTQLPQNNKKRIYNAKSMDFSNLNTGGRM